PGARAAGQEGPGERVRRPAAPAERGPHHEGGPGRTAAAAGTEARAGRRVRRRAARSILLLPLLLHAGFWEFYQYNGVAFLPVIDYVMRFLHSSFI
ncbi:unnamed protein product, partial [Heterosigma akashiwo]